MSGYATGRRPRTDAEWAREIQRRIETLETNRSVRVGDWVLNARNGDLIATSPGNHVVLSDPVLSPTAAVGGSISLNKILAAILAQLTDSTNLDFTGPSQFLTSLIQNLFNHTSDGAGGGGLDLTSPQTLVDSILHLLGLDGGPLDINAVIQVIATSLGFPSPTVGSMEELQAWIAHNVFGFIDPNRIPIIPVSHIGDTSPNLLSNPQFTDIAIYDPDDNWIHDLSVNHSGVGGAASIVGDGRIHELRSVDLIGVAREQKLDISAWVKMTGLVASQPEAVSLSVVTFTTPDGTGTETITVLDSVDTYGTKDWQKLAGVFVVPVDVMTLRVRIAVNAAATAGKVWFDDLWASKQGLLNMSLVEGLQDALVDLGNKIKEVFDQIVAGLEQAGQDLTAAVQDMLDKLREYLRLDEWQSFLDNLWQNLTGVKPDTTITANDAADQFALLMATTAAQATTIAQIQAAINKPSGGLVGGDDFERADAQSLGTGWTTTSDNSSGKFGITKGEAIWLRSGIAGNVVRCFRVDPKDAQTKTPYQTITRVTGTTVLQPVFLADSPVDMVFGRVSPDHKKYMVARWFIAADGSGRISLGYNLGTANDVIIMTVPADKPAPGATLTLECGDSSTLYSYRVIRNNSVLIEWDDSPTSPVTAPLSTNLGWGFGGQALVSLTGQIAPSSAHSVTVADTRSP